MPQLSQRTDIAFPKRSSNQTLENSEWMTLLLNPSDPGWGSSESVQRRLLNQARDRNWHCRGWSSGLTLCQRPVGEQQSLPDNEPGDTDPSG